MRAHCMTGLMLAIPRAQACDHRYGAEATWSHSTDTGDAGTFFYAEACAFKFNLAVTVFDSPFRFSHPWMSLPEKQAAARTGRVSFEVYFQTDRWCDPQAAPGTEPFPQIPDYDATQWSAAAVAAGFQVEPGAAKPKRFPNHGQELFDISGGQYGYDEENNRPGANDVLSLLIDHHIAWIQNAFGYVPAAAAFRGSTTGPAYAFPRFFLAGRGAYGENNLGYGKSTQGQGFLGSNRPFELSPHQSANLPMTTRVGDMDLPRDEALRHCETLLRDAIRTRGWYVDFVHWHNYLGLTDPGRYATLHEVFASQRRAMAGADVATLGYGEAIQHKFLRDMATVTTGWDQSDLMIHVVYRDPYGSLPLNTIRIPLSVRVDVSATPWQGQDVISPDARGIRRLAPDIFVVEVPFHQKEETVTVRLQLAPRETTYTDFGLPVILALRSDRETFQIVTDKPTRVAIFMGKPGDNLRAVVPLGRSPTLECRHAVVPAGGMDGIEGRDIYIGAITETGQSILCGPCRKQPGAEGNWTFPQGPDGRVNIRSELKGKP